MASKPKLTQLFLFNSNWGPREGQEDQKVVFFWPQETEINTQIRSIGLIEAVIRFGETFSKKPAHSLHTQKTRTVWKEVEENFFLCFTVTVPSIKKAGKDGADVLEFRPEDVSDSVLLGVLERAHSMFSLFLGGLDVILDTNNGDKEVVREKTNHFYTRYLATLRLENSSVLDMWGGLQYLPLESELFLRVQTLVTRNQEMFTNIHSSLFLQQGQLVWSGLVPDTTRLLVHYLTTTLLPSLTTLPSPSPTSPHQGRFLVGGQDIDTLPLVHLTTGQYHLVVFHAINSTLCMLLSHSPDQQFYSSVSSSLGPTLSNLSADLTHIWVNTSNNNPVPQDMVKFIYFNAANFAVKSTVDPGNENLVNLASELASDLPEGGEVTAKLNTDQWLVVRVAGVRTVIVILNQKNLNLMEVSEEVARLDKSSFGRICML
eukprot:TRINITY_DN15853_c0_g1_i1.p1 TRINITY_DN15853_c0_g1~~TRINITY_DN15853_c0_g1_i1.p1  ORF type:complete len:430 (-),score=152.12 TRINITY_DN15853_c0_g1_i1:44-1333(-)